MAPISATVGDPTNRAFNKREDVAIIQALLGILKDPKGRRYLGSPYDGRYGLQSKLAIAAFQADYHTAADPRKTLAVCVPMPVWTRSPNFSELLLDTPGLITADGETLRQMNAMLPQMLSDIKIAPNTCVVYKPSLATEAAQTASKIEADSSLEQAFRGTVAKLVRRMYDAYGIALSIATDGGKRTFQQQYNIATTSTATNAGPGESNHNWGKAVDIGFDGLRWLNSGETLISDDSWLNKLSKLHPSRTADLWAIRNAIAFDELDMFPSNKAGDLIHIQAYSDDNVSMRKSLAAQLSRKGKFQWRYAHSESYECNLGFGNTWRNVGNANDIWDGNVKIERQWLASGRGISAESVTESDIAAMKAALRADFDAAEAAPTEWQPISK